MFCHKCGSKVDDDAAFCHKCGTSVKPTNSEVNTTIDYAASTDTLERPIILYLSFTVSAISIILFFFPWFKIIGQGIFAFLGYGSKDGFNLISFYLMINKLMDYSNFTFGAKVVVIIIALAIGAGAPLLGLLSHLANCFTTLTIREMVTKRTVAGPLWFIVGYYILQYITKAYVYSTTSSDLLGELASMLFGNLLSMTSIPWILLALGIINSCLELAWEKVSRRSLSQKNLP